MYGEPSVPYSKIWLFVWPLIAQNKLKMINETTKRLS